MLIVSILNNDYLYYFIKDKISKLKLYLYFGFIKLFKKVLKINLKILNILKVKVIIKVLFFINALAMILKDLGASYSLVIFINIDYTIYYYINFKLFKYLFYY
ncbi:hypothetical protein B0T21DRAFT_351886 [Apiosordaria backusii]|uniref:Uncharacterized protein n=1 Tax=Apiosordaria backusii TaxID=314023 RepID=A0AA40DUW1_9PEZI|nr:hypothetical protein B0T21DRAFT_351886 [Apiosordaria backusii]